jgi:hypothetical protein
VDRYDEPQRDEAYRHYGRDMAGELDEFLREYGLFDDQVGLVVGPVHDEDGTPVIQVNARTVDGPEYAEGVTYMYDTEKAFPRLEYETVEREVYPAVVEELAYSFPGAQLQAYGFDIENSEDRIDGPDEEYRTE